MNEDKSVVKVNTPEEYFNRILEVCDALRVITKFTGKPLLSLDKLYPVYNMLRHLYTNDVGLYDKLFEDNINYDILSFNPECELKYLEKINELSSDNIVLNIILNHENCSKDLSIKIKKKLILD